MSRWSAFLMAFAAALIASSITPLFWYDCIKKDRYAKTSDHHSRPDIFGTLSDGNAGQMAGVVYDEVENTRILTTSKLFIQANRTAYASKFSLHLLKSPNYNKTNLIMN